MKKTPKVSRSSLKLKITILVFDCLYKKPLRSSSSTVNDAEGQSQGNSELSVIPLQVFTLMSSSWIFRYHSWCVCFSARNTAWLWYPAWRRTLMAISTSKWTSLSLLCSNTEAFHSSQSYSLGFRESPAGRHEYFELCVVGLLSIAHLKTFQSVGP